MGPLACTTPKATMSTKNDKTAAFLNRADFKFWRIQFRGFENMFFLLGQVRQQNKLKCTSN
jgi:hypothetical protein